MIEEKLGSENDIFSQSALELTPNKQRALEALLASNSVGAAAEMAELSPRTLWRYLADPDFQEVYREHRAMLLQQTITALQRVGAEAVAVLQDSISPEEEANLRLRAARSALDHMFRGVETERKIREQEEILERLEVLEEERKYHHEY
jgi:hypothetical protein